MDWLTVFDEAHPKAGASDAEIAHLVASVRQPLSDAELAAVNRSQKNPFPKGDPLYFAYRPFDPTRWVIPNRPLPSPYLAFLRWSNGGEFRTGDRWFQFFPALDPNDGVRAMLLAYHLPQYIPQALPIAFNGGGTFYLFDMRQEATDGEYPVICSHAGNLGWEPDECFRVAESFGAVCRGTISLDQMR
jgi:hypothetical protein